jgi:hypothetical protein
MKQYVVWFSDPDTQEPILSVTVKAKTMVAAARKAQKLLLEYLIVDVEVGDDFEDIVSGCCSESDEDVAEQEQIKAKAEKKTKKKNTAKKSLKPDPVPEPSDGELVKKG